MHMLLKHIIIELRESCRNSKQLQTFVWTLPMNNEHAVHRLLDINCFCLSTVLNYGSMLLEMDLIAV